MQRFTIGHAAHADWRSAFAQAAAQVGERLSSSGGAAGPAELGFVYFTDHYAMHAEPLLEALQLRWPGVRWVGTVGVGVAANSIEYFDEPALVLMLATLPAGSFRVFSGARPLTDFAAHTALIHADGSTPDLAELITDMSARTTSRYLFGGLAASRTRSCQVADGVFEGGLSGVAFSSEVALLSRVTQGCQPVGPVRQISGCERNLVTELDGEPALACLLHDLEQRPDQRAAPARLAALRATLVGLSEPREALLARGGQFGADTRVRHLIGLDPARQGVAVAEIVESGMQLAFCQRDVSAARRDLVRICAEIRDELAPEPALALTAGDDSGPTDASQRIAGAIYVSCAGRGGPHFGAPSAELQIVQHALGNVPLVGFFAGGEIGHHHLYGYTGVLTVFCRNA